MMGRQQREVSLASGSKLENAGVEGAVAKLKATVRAGRPRGSGRAARACGGRAAVLSQGAPRPGGRWKAAGAGVEGGVAVLKLTSKGEEIEKQLPGGKVKKKARPEVVLETSTRSKKKCVTTILGARPALRQP
jgi:hypothetical protein